MAARPAIVKQVQRALADQPDVVVDPAAHRPKKPCDHPAPSRVLVATAELCKAIEVTRQGLRISQQKRKTKKPPGLNPAARRARSLGWFRLLLRSSACRQPSRW